MHKKIIILLLIFAQIISAHNSSSEREAAIIEHALSLVLEKTENNVSDEQAESVLSIRRASFEFVQKAEYASALEVIVNSFAIFPKNFSLQSTFATVVGDFAEVALGEEIRERMLQKSKEVFEKLMLETEGKPKQQVYYFKNEYFYRFAMHKQQYMNGVDRTNDCFVSGNLDYAYNGYYCQGVGAARYAEQLLKQGDKELALEYAQIAVIAWAQYFTYKNDYYNSYVHYALALGILGYKQEMIRALQKSANIIGKDLSYYEFEQVIKFIDEFA